MTTPTRTIDGVTHVWSIADNAWVTLDYWNYINGRQSKTHGTSGGVELTDEVVGRLADEAEQGYDVGQLKSGTKTGVTKLETTNDITEEITILIWGIIADRYRDSPTNWHAVWEIAQGAHLEDGTLLDLGSDYEAPLLQELKDRVEKS